MGDLVLAVGGQGVLTRNKASLASAEAIQIRTLDSVSFNAAETAYAAHNPKLFALAVRRLRYRPAFQAWLALHPLKNPKAPPDPSYMPQYRIPQQTQATTLAAQADAYFTRGQSAAGTADKYVRLTVFVAAVLFLVGIGSRFPVRVARRAHRGRGRTARRVGGAAARAARAAGVIATLR